MARIPIYRHSVLATLLSITAYLFMLGGLTMAFSESVLSGVILFAMGLGISFLASMLAEKTEYKAVVRQIRKKKLEDRLRGDIAACEYVYNQAPGSGMLRYIRKMNPEAAEHIAAKLAEKKAAGK